MLCALVVSIPIPIPIPIQNCKHMQWSDDLRPSGRVKDLYFSVRFRIVAACAFAIICCRNVFGTIAANGPINLKS